MATPAKPNDYLHRYLLRPGAVRKARRRAERALRHGTRSALGDIRSLLPEPAGTVLDVGANIGYVATDFHKAWPKATVHCFEPTEQTFQRLLANTADVPQITCHQLAVSDQDGTATFQVDNTTHGGGSNTLLHHSAEFELRVSAQRFRPVEVTTVRLDTFCKEQGIDHVDLLKLDIEGAEPLALRGAKELLATSAIDVILSEVRLIPAYDGDLLLNDLMTQLAEDDYRAYGIYRFAESAIGQSSYGDAVFLGPGFRKRLVDLHGAKACGFLH
jgi:FkbM family methyltransferase